MEGRRASVACVYWSDAPQLSCMYVELQATKLKGAGHLRAHRHSDNLGSNAQSARNFDVPTNVDTILEENRSMLKIVKKLMLHEVIG